MFYIPEKETTHAGEASSKEDVSVLFSLLFSLSGPRAA